MTAPAPDTAPLTALTDRERELLVMMGRGYTNEEIAREWWVSPHTIRTHANNIHWKLRCRTRLGALLAAVRAGFLDECPTCGRGTLRQDTPEVTP